MEDRIKLVGLIDSLKIIEDISLNDYIEETISTFKRDCRRSTIILLWSIWTFFLYKKIKEFGLKNFVHFCRDKKIKFEGNIIQIYDLNKIKDKDLLFLCRESGFYDANVENQLINLLNLRNSCAHVAQLSITEYQLFSYVEQMCSYIEIIKKLDYTQIHKSFIEELKFMDKQKIEQIISSMEFDVLNSYFDKCLEEVCLITNSEEYQKSKGLYYFLSLIVASREKDDEKVYFFEKLFAKISSEEIPYDLEIIEELPNMLNYVPIKRNVFAKGYLNFIIKIFVKSGSFNLARLNAKSLLIFKGDLNKEQIKTIADAYISNGQITGSSGAKIALKFIFEKNRALLPEDLIKEVMEKGLIF